MRTRCDRSSRTKREQYEGKKGEGDEPSVFFFFALQLYGEDRMDGKEEVGEYCCAQGEKLCYVYCPEVQN